MLSEPIVMETNMKFIRFLRGARGRMARTMHDDERLQRTMPGETGALAALRLGMLVG